MLILEQYVNSVQAFLLPYELWPFTWLIIFAGFYLLKKEWDAAFTLSLLFGLFDPHHSLFFAPLLFAAIKYNNTFITGLAVSAWILLASNDAPLGLLLAVAYRPKDTCLWFGLVCSLFTYPVVDFGDYPGEARLADVSEYNEAHFSYLSAAPYPSSISGLSLDSILDFSKLKWAAVAALLLFFCRTGGLLFLLAAPFLVLHFWPEFLRLMPGQILSVNPQNFLGLWFLYCAAKINSNFGEYKFVLFAFALFAVSAFLLDSSDRVEVAEYPRSQRLLRAGHSSSGGSAKFDLVDPQFVCEQTNLSFLPGAAVGPEETTDMNPNTRWSGEELEFFITTDQLIYAVRLSTGEFKTDFPQKFAVYKDGKRINSGRWRGTIRWTPSGLPYWGPQHDVLVRFKEPLTSGSYKVVLLSKDQHFDWSVAEIEAYTSTCSK